jgi:Na+/proline symporter
MDERRRASVHAHPLEVVSLAIGIILLTLGLVFAVGDVDVTRIGVGWIWFGILAATGLVLLALAWRRHKAYADEREMTTPSAGGMDVSP